MRAVELPEKVDILVSELLGSFGDNELSPECLDGAARFLKRKSYNHGHSYLSGSLTMSRDTAEGISIPASYTAYLAPLSSSKLHNEARNGGRGDQEKAAETPYVVMFQAVNVLSGDGGGASGRCGPQIQSCWEFEHPRRDIVLDARGMCGLSIFILLWLIVRAIRTPPDKHT
jgi:type II protein arginine methyltransferase